MTRGVRAAAEWRGSGGREMVIWSEQSECEGFMGYQPLGEGAGGGSGLAQEAGVQAGNRALPKSWQSSG